MYGILFVFIEIKSNPYIVEIDQCSRIIDIIHFHPCLVLNSGEVSLYFKQFQLQQVINKIIIVFMPFSLIVIVIHKNYNGTTEKHYYKKN